MVSRFESRQEKKSFFFNLQSIHIGSGANPASCSRVSGVKRPRREVDPHLRLVQSENLYFLNGIRGHSCHYPTTVVWYAMPWNFLHRYERFAAKCRIILLGVLPKPWHLCKKKLHGVTNKGTKLYCEVPTSRCISFCYIYQSSSPQYWDGGKEAPRIDPLRILFELLYSFSVNRPEVIKVFSSHVCW